MNFIMHKMYPETIARQTESLASNIIFNSQCVIVQVLSGKNHVTSIQRTQITSVLLLLLLLLIAIQI